MTGYLKSCVKIDGVGELCEDVGDAGYVLPSAVRSAAGEDKPAHCWIVNGGSRRIGPMNVPQRSEQAVKTLYTGGHVVSLGIV